MAMLLMGVGPRVAWVRALLTAGPSAALSAGTSDIRLVSGPPTRDLLTLLGQVAIDSLVLVDHAPFAAGWSAAGLSAADVVRNEGLRGVLAVELARRAERTLVLSHGDAGSWVAALSGFVGATLPRDGPGPLPPIAAAEVVATPLQSAYLEPLFTAVQRLEPLVLTWPRESFIDGDEPGKTLPATVEVAGRARILAYGPYLPLPMGRWQATACLGFSPDIDKMPFILEADTGGTVSRGFFEVSRGGIFTLDLEFEVTDSMHPVEMRLISQESALEGQVALIEIELAQITAR